MRVTYISHSGYLVELERVALIFDWWKGEVALPTDKPTVAFASHAHHDHYNPDLLFGGRLGDRAAAIVLSDDIPRASWEGRRGAGRVTAMGPREQVGLDLGDGTRLTVDSFLSTDEGVAFLVRVGEGGPYIYHAGDLNNWSRAANGAEYCQTWTAAYHAELETVRAATGERPVDVAMLPLDPRLDDDHFWMGVDDFMRLVGARHVFPMHMWGDYTVVDRLLALQQTDGYRERVARVKADGQVWEVEA